MGHIAVSTVVVQGDPAAARTWLSLLLLLLLLVEGPSIEWLSCLDRCCATLAWVPTLLGWAGLGEVWGEQQVYRVIRKRQSLVLTFVGWGAEREDRLENLRCSQLDLVPLQPTTTGCACSVYSLERLEPGRETGGTGARTVEEVAVIAAFVAASVPYLEASSGMETWSVGCGRIVEHWGTVEHRSL